MKTFVWLSFDLGIRGDYEGMYQFLDTYGAKECGDSLGTFWYEYRFDFLAELKEELNAKISFNNRSRVYIIYSSEPGNLRGEFIIGKRKSPPWTGFSISQSDEVDTSA